MKHPEKKAEQMTQEELASYIDYSPISKINAQKHTVVVMMEPERRYMEMKHPEKKAEQMTQEELASYIDYSVLKPEFTEEEIIELTKDGVKKKCATICINPKYIELCEPFVRGTATKLAPVADFPFGTSSTESRIRQIQDAARSPAVMDIDIVANYGQIRSGRYEEVLEDLKQCAQAAHDAGKTLKVILETDALTEEQVRKGTRIVKESGADFVKTSTGFLTQAAHDAGKTLKVILETDALTEEQVRKGTRIVKESGADFVKTSTGFLTGHESHGATPEVIAIMMEEAGPDMKVKGSGCIRTRDHFLKLIDMGIDRMGVGYKSVPVVLGIGD